MSESFAVLVGTGPDRLRLDFNDQEFSRPGQEIVVWELGVSVSLSGGEPRVDQNMSAAIYGPVDLASLECLVDGDAASRFEFETLGFQLNIFEHQSTLGPAYGYVVTGRMCSAEVARYDRWEETEIANDLLRSDTRSSRVLLHFAFLVEYEALRSFYNELRQCNRLFR